MNTKKFIQILAVSATALITACEEQLTSNDLATPITVTSQVSEKTRAGYDNANLPSAFVMDIEQGSESYNYSLVTMTRESNSNAYSAPADMLLLWKGSDHSSANIKAMTIPYGLTAIDPTNAMTVKVHTDQSTDANVKASDLLGAKTGDGISINGDNINIEFRHLLSKLYVNYEFANGLRNPRVNSITLEEICVQGGYSYKDMDYDNSTLDYGNITMFHNSSSKAAEAIFFPHTPDSKLNLKVDITVGGKNKSLSCPIELKSGKSFEGRKQYTMNIKINGTSINNAYITTVKDWISDNGSMTNKKILWTGTSIPAGDFVNNYPNMIAAATGYTIVNNALPGSFLYFATDMKIPWQTSTDVRNILNYVHTYSLAGTHEEMKDRWYDELKAIQEKENLPKDSLDAWMDFIYSSSYESRIIPYIDGTIDNCNVLILDFGFNDRLYIGMECNGHRVGSEVPNGLSWLESLIAGTTQYSDIFQFGLKSYFVCMDRIITACKEANPNLKIIIGNYFAQSVPKFDDSSYGMVALGGAESAKLLTKANEAVAAMHDLDIVNVYKYTGLDDESSHDLYNTLVPVDGVHPVNDPLGRLNRIIANIYLEEFRRIFGE